MLCSLVSSQELFCMLNFATFAGARKITLYVVRLQKLSHDLINLLCENTTQIKTAISTETLDYTDSSNLCILQIFLLDHKRTFEMNKKVA